MLVVGDTHPEPYRRACVVNGQGYIVLLGEGLHLASYQVNGLVREGPVTAARRGALGRGTGVPELSDHDEKKENRQTTWLRFVVR